jgi:hypothetical protein
MLENRTVERAKINLVSLVVNATLMKVELDHQHHADKELTAKLNMSRYFALLSRIG